MITNKVLSKLFVSFKINCAVPTISITGTPHQQRYKNNYHRNNIPRLRFPYWYVKQYQDKFDEKLTEENKNFINNVVHDTYGPPGIVGGVETFLHSPLKQEPVLRGTWFPECMRTGLIAVKLGTLPQWLKNGQIIYTTLLQVIDNHVIKFIPPGENDLRHYGKKLKKRKDLGSLLVGAINCDPREFTESYCGLFFKAGVMPKKILTKFFIHPEANIQPGTPLFAAHFKVGDMVDVTGTTIYRGFQGVMKRWGFHGMPASHGQTKTHRRPGNIGAGGEKARVWPGKKMPGHVGYKTRTQSGLMIVRINHKYNVIYTRGPGIPGGTNGIVYIHDTLIKAKRPTTPPHFPTYYPQDHQEELPEEEFHESLFRFSDPSLEFEEIRAAAKN